MKTLIPATLILAITTPALGQRAGGLVWLSGEIRGQIAAVEAQAATTLARCDDADDVFDELRDLCRDMDRFEACLQQPIVSRSQLRRLARRARDVDEQACELQEEIEEALEDLRDDYRRFGQRGPRGSIALHQVGHPHGRVNTHQLAQRRGYTELIRGGRNASFAFGGHRGASIRVGFGPAFGIYGVGHPVVPGPIVTGPIVRGPIVPGIDHALPAPGFGHGGHFRGPRLGFHGPQLGGFDDGCALREQMARLRGLTQQLRRIVRG